MDTHTHTHQQSRRPELQATPPKLAGQCHDDNGRKSYRQMLVRRPNWPLHLRLFIMQQKQLFQQWSPSFWQWSGIVLFFPKLRPASVAQRQRVGLGIERSRVRNSLLPSGELIGTAKRPSSLRMLIGPSPHYCSLIGRAPVHSTVKISTWCFHHWRKLQPRQ